jgi:phosphoenolpyruvate phosphomutase
MKALILNSGTGSRMGVITKEQPKCMTEVSHRNTILSRQLRQLVSFGIEEVVITTGYYDEVLIDYCNALYLPLKFTFVNNPLYDKTNYIYSIYCAKDCLKDDDVLLMHGDLVFESLVMEAVLNSETSCMTVSSTLPLPEKDFKAVIKDGRIDKIGVGFFDNAVAAQPLYKIRKEDWLIWLENIERFCENDKRQVYAENAFNEVSDKCLIHPLDIKDMLCSEIDTPEDLEAVKKALAKLNERTVYMSFSTEYIHSGHISIINKARRLGRLIVGILSDEAVSSFRRFPLIPFEDRKALIENIAGVERVVEQKSLSYAENLRVLKPDYVVHGDDWLDGFQKPIRQEVCEVLEEYGGKLIEYPYSNDPKFKELDAKHRAELSMPDIRRGRLRKLINMKGLVTALEAHSGITGLICEKTKVRCNVAFKPL